MRQQIQAARAEEQQQMQAKSVRHKQEMRFQQLQTEASSAGYQQQQQQQQQLRKVEFMQGQGRSAIDRYVHTVTIRIRTTLLE